MIVSNRVRRIGRRALATGVGSLLAAPAIVRAQGPNGVVLLIGNSKYQFEAQLPNVKRDVHDVAKSFQALGLKTEIHEDLGREAMLRILEKFGSTTSGMKLGAVYFAGHGVFLKGISHFVPIDVDLSDEISAKVISPLAIGKAVLGAEHRLVILDNCRNNVDGGRRAREEKNAQSMSPGLANVLLLQQPNALWLCSTQPGNIALDGPAGQNSPFASALMRELAGPSVDLLALPAKMRRSVLLATEGQQLTYDLSTMTAPFPLTVTGKPITRHSGPSFDPSRVIELNNAYAFAEKNELYLPPGLIAYRPPNSSPDAHMAGAYAGEIRVSVGERGTAIVPVVYIVLSLPGSDTAEIVATSKQWTGSLNGPYWRYVTGARTGDKMSVPSFSAGGSATELWWRDRDPMTITQSGRSASPLKRLDG